MNMAIHFVALDNNPWSHTEIELFEVICYKGNQNLLLTKGSS